MIGILLATATLTEYAAASMATVGVIGAVWGAARIARNGKGQSGVYETHARLMEGQLRSHDAKLDKIDEKLGGMHEVIGKMHGTLRMLPCVREDKTCDEQF